MAYITKEHEIHMDLNAYWHILCINYRILKKNSILKENGHLQGYKMYHFILLGEWGGILGL
jgi:hypothetical protein